MVVNTATKKHVNKLVPYDKLELMNKLPDGSRYRGDLGIYFFKHTKGTEPTKPVSWCYLNHKYLTGLFPTKNPLVFNGDIKAESGKIYLVFKISDNIINIFQRLEMK